VSSNQAFNAGTQERYHLATPCCGELVYLTSDNLEKTVRVGGEGACRTQAEPKADQAAEGGTPERKAPALERRSKRGAPARQARGLSLPRDRLGRR
jgi:phage terminase large subunit GpA-like protein